MDRVGGTLLGTSTSAAKQVGATPWTILPRAAELLASLEPDDQLAGEAWNVAWRDELQRRIADPSPGVAWEDARAQLDARLAAVRAERSGR